MFGVHTFIESVVVVEAAIVTGVGAVVVDGAVSVGVAVVVVEQHDLVAIRRPTVQRDRDSVHQIEESTLIRVNIDKSQH
jgi:hypothetical protein